MAQLEGRYWSNMGHPGGDVAGCWSGLAAVGRLLLEHVSSLSLDTLKSKIRDFCWLFWVEYF